MGMAGYTKLFNSILASTIWREPNHVRIVWITLLAMADKNGVAEGSVPGLADFARVSIEECRDALQRLQDPDRDSRSQEFDGRRITDVDGGWLLLNHEKYRQKLNEDERREYLRIKKAESRGRQRDVNKTAEESTAVNSCLDSSTPSTQAEAEAEADTDTEAVRTPPTPSKGVSRRRRRMAGSDDEQEQLRRTQEVKRLMASGVPLAEAQRRVGYQ